MEYYLHISIFIAGFTLIALAAKQVGGFFVKVKLHMISGFLFTGIIAGPFVLGLIPYELLRIVERVTPEELSTRSLEAEVKEIIRDKDDIPENRFDKLIKESVVLDIEHVMAADEFFIFVAEKLSERVNEKSEVLLKLLMEREKKGGTAINPLIAIPHIIIDGEHTFCILLARCMKGITFSESAPRVQVVFVLVGSRDEHNFHLSALSTIARIVQDPHFNKRWFKAKGEKALRNVVLQSTGRRK